MIEDYLKTSGEKNNTTSIEDLPFLFGRLLRDTDQWSVLPFKLNEKYCDFANSNFIEKVEPFDEHRQLDNPNFSGFISFQQKQQVSSLGFFIPTFGYILEGELRYLQDDNNSKGIKKSAFIKNNYTLFVSAHNIGQVFSTSPNEKTKNTTHNYKISRVEKVTCFDTHDKYTVGIFQQPQDIQMLINTSESKALRSQVENVKKPLIHVSFTGKNYDYILNMLQSNMEAFATLRNMSAAFTNATISNHSVLLKLTKVEDILPTFSEAAMITRHLSANNKLNYF
jgi:hypothetical protein